MKSASSDATGAWPLLFSLLAAVLLAAIFAHAFMRMPFPYGDNFKEVADLYKTPISENFTHYFTRPRVFFRPLEIVWRYAIAYGFNQGVFGYNLFLCALLTLVVTTFALICHPKDGRDLVAFLVALAVLTGHQAMQGSWEFATAISNGVVLAAATVSIGLIGRSGAILQQVLIVVLTALCLLTKELGLVIAGIFVLAHLLGMPGVRRTTAAIIAMMVLAYLIYHFSNMVDVPSASWVRPNRASTLGQYLSNIVATFVQFWVGLPFDGNWAQWNRFLGYPWQWIQIGAGLATPLFLVGAWRLAPTPAERATGDGPAFDWRWPVLFIAALLGCSALGFFYARHRHCAPAVPLLAYCTYLSMRVLLWRLDDIAELSPARSSPLLTWVTIAGLACAVLWPLRVVTGFESVRYFSIQIRKSWPDHMTAFWNQEPDSTRPFLIPIVQSVDRVPWPRKYVPMLQLLGDWVKDSVNR
jgi:hypothetical protein